MTTPDQPPEPPDYENYISDMAMHAETVAALRKEHAAIELEVFEYTKTRQARQKEIKSLIATSIEAKSARHRAYEASRAAYRGNLASYTQDHAQEALQDAQEARAMAQEAKETHRAQTRTNKFEGKLRVLCTNKNNSTGKIHIQATRDLRRLFDTHAEHDNTMPTSASLNGWWQITRAAHRDYKLACIQDWIYTHMDRYRAIYAADPELYNKNQERKQNAINVHEKQVMILGSTLAQVLDIPPWQASWYGYGAYDNRLNEVLLFEPNGNVTKIIDPAIIDAVSRTGLASPSISTR